MEQRCLGAIYLAAPGFSRLSQEAPPPRVAGMAKMLGRVAGALIAFEVGRVVGRRWRGGLDAEVGKALGKGEGLAAAAGATTLGWAMLTRRERVIAFALGAAS